MTADETSAVIRRARTDSERTITYDPVNRPEVSGLLATAAIVLGRTPTEIADEVGSAGAGALKRLTTEAVNEYLADHRARRAAIAVDDVAAVLREGNERAQSIDVPAPFDSYTLLGELTATVDDLEQVCRQLGAWHSNVVDGKHYAGEDARGDGVTGTVTAAAELERAAAALDATSAALRAAHSANGVVRWFDAIEEN